MSSTNDIESSTTGLQSERKQSKVTTLTFIAIIIILLLLNIAAWVLFGITKKQLGGISKNEQLDGISKNNYLPPQQLAEFEMNALRGKKHTKFEFKLNPEFNLSSSVLKLSKNDFTWDKHRQFCRDEVEKNSYHSYQVVENKLLTKKMIESEQFKEYAENHYNADINELLNDLMPKRYYELTIDANTNMIDEKQNFLNNKCDQIIARTQSEFVYKAVHLAANAGVKLMDKNKWNKGKWTCEKLWNALEDVLKTKVDAHYSVAKNQETDEALNPGIVIENRFPIFGGCGNVFPVAEIKIMTLWGRVIQAVDACDQYKPVYRFKDGSFVVPEAHNYEATETDYKIQQSIDVHWEKLVKWSEIIANYVGADRLRIDWFHKYDSVQFNELGYPGALGHNDWNKMFSDILYDGYKDNIYQKRHSTDLL